MSYQITYQSAGESRGTKRRAPRASVLTLLFLLTFFILTGCLWPQGRNTLRRLLIPGDPAVTTAALESFALELKSGSGLSSAFMAFCRRILLGAGLACG